MRGRSVHFAVVALLAIQLFNTSLSIEWDLNPSNLEGSNGPMDSARDGSDLIAPYWNTTLVDDNQSAGIQSSMVIDSTNRIHISHMEQNENTMNRTLKYSLFNGTSWYSTIVDDSVFLVGAESSIDIDSRDNPHISYSEDTYGVDPIDLKYAYYDGNTWAVSVIHSDTKAGESSIAIDSNDVVHIAYIVRVVGNPDSKIVYYANNHDGNWNKEQITSDSYGDTLSLVLDSNDKPIISFLDHKDSTSKIKIASQSDAVFEIDTVSIAEQPYRYDGLSTTIDSENNLFFALFQRSTNSSIVDQQGAYCIKRWSGNDTVEILKLTNMISAGPASIIIGYDKKIHLFFSGYGSNVIRHFSSGNQTSTTFDNLSAWKNSSSDIPPPGASLGSAAADSLKGIHISFRNDGLFHSFTRFCENVDNDSDRDCTADDIDEFPNNPNEISDSDGDGVGNNSDYFPNDPNEQKDSDRDGIGDNSDSCPGFDDSIDADSDGTPDGCDSLIDSDGDGVSDSTDQCEGHDDSIDVDSDGIPDGCDSLIDSDGDGVSDSTDQCEGHDDSIDADSDGIPDGCDSLIDSDGDGVVDSDDEDEDEDGVVDSDDEDADVNSDDILDITERAEGNEGVDVTETKSPKALFLGLLILSVIATLLFRKLNDSAHNTSLKYKSIVAPITNYENNNDDVYFNHDQVGDLTVMSHSGYEKGVSVVSSSPKKVVLQLVDESEDNTLEFVTKLFMTQHVALIKNEDPPIRITSNKGLFDKNTSAVSFQTFKKTGRYILSKIHSNAKVSLTYKNRIFGLKISKISIESTTSKGTLVFEHKV
jgi:hypothetical protein